MLPRHGSVRGLTRRAAGSWCVDVQESGSAEVKRGVFVSNEEEVEVEEACASGGAVGVCAWLTADDVTRLR